jgi:hypothetical protein
MKTYTLKKSDQGFLSRPEQSNTAGQGGQAQHNANRRLSTQTVLEYLRTKLPQHYELAEIVGSWIWIELSPARQEAIATVLWDLGFHWNKRRQVWQHPCGMFEPFTPHPADPRSKYGSRFITGQ